jgi:hypothetical protein
MSQPKISRSEFVRGGTCLAAGTLLGNLAATPATPCQACAAKAMAPVAVRPYQLLCTICALGRPGTQPQDPKLKKLFDTVQKSPDVPLALHCNAGDVYVYQNPGPADDGDGSPEFNRKRDMEILQRLDMAPGEVQPARIALARVFTRIRSVAGICTFGATTSPAWRGCPRAASGDYERGHKRGLAAIVPPRTAAAMARDKETSAKVLYEGRGVKVRPHILLCSVCQYGGGTRPPFKPDNLPEMLELVLTKRPDLPITLVQGADWMMCAPCASRSVALNACVCGPNKSGGLYNEMKDLNVLQRVGLTYGSTLPAREMYLRILEKIPTVEGACAIKVEGLPSYSIWYDPCGQSAHPNYTKGRSEILAKLQSPPANRV